MAEKKKRTQYTTPKGCSFFANIVNVDYGTEKFPKEKGDYNLRLLLSEADAKALRDKLAPEIKAAREFVKEGFAKLKPAAKAKLKDYTFNMIGEEHFDKEGEPTGDYKFNFKTGATYKDKGGNEITRKIPVFDSMMQPVKLKEEPGNGSIIRVSFSCAPYFVEGSGQGGLSLYLDAVQIVKLVKFGARSASDYGFGEEEDGFSAADMADEDDDSGEVEGNGSESAKAEDDDELPF